jgi:hypothetical protein
MDRLQRLFAGAGAAASTVDLPIVDTSEVIHISSLALLKVK